MPQITVFLSPSTSERRRCQCLRTVYNHPAMGSCTQGWTGIRRSTPSSQPPSLPTPSTPTHRAGWAQPSITLGWTLVSIHPCSGLSFASAYSQRLGTLLELLSVLKTAESMRTSVTWDGGGGMEVALEEKRSALCFLLGQGLTNPSQPDRGFSHRVGRG